MFASAFVLFALALSAFSAPQGGTSVPKFTNPKPGDIWKNNQTYNVTWSKHDPTILFLGLTYLHIWND
jgi:hypothetical protein